MRKLYIIFCISCICTFYSSAVAQTIWTGSKTTFTKADGADWTQAANQDRITTNVWITRANSQGIFNIVLESGFDNTNRDSPKDTEWAFGIASNYESLTFNNWATTINNLPESSTTLSAAVFGPTLPSLNASISIRLKPGSRVM